MSNLLFAIMEACAEVEKWAYTIDAIFLNPIECIELKNKFESFEPISSLLYIKSYYGANHIGELFGKTIVSFSKIPPGYIFILKNEDMLGFSAYDFDISRCKSLGLERYNTKESRGRLNL